MYILVYVLSPGAAMSVSVGSGRLVCTVCSVYRTDTLSELLSHIRLFHAHQPSLNIRCGISGCRRSFGNFGTFQNHISMYHRMEASPTNVLDLVSPERVHQSSGKVIALTCT